MIDQIFRSGDESTLGQGPRDQIGNGGEVLWGETRANVEGGRMRQGAAGKLHMGE